MKWKEKNLCLVCAGLDSVQRGYETHIRLLMNALKQENIPDWHITLFKRDGNSTADEVCLHTFSRTNTLLKLLAFFRGDRIYWESIFFALAFILYCWLRNFRPHRIYSPEPVVSKTLYRLKFLLPNSPQIIFMHGVWMKPWEYAYFGDVIQEVSIENYQQMLSFLQDASRITLLPHFLNSGIQTTSDHERTRLRKKYGIVSKKVVISVGVVTRGHKRIDYLIDEINRVDKTWSLVVCGNAHDQNLVQYGKDQLQDRFIHVSLPRSQVFEIYQVADLFVLCSTTEGFGIVILEAMSHQLPIFVHKRPLFEWIVKDSEQCIDMTIAGNLADAITNHGTDPEWRQIKGRSNACIFQKNYSWPGVRNDYLKLLLKDPVTEVPRFFV